MGQISKIILIFLLLLLNSLSIAFASSITVSGVYSNDLIWSFDTVYISGNTTVLSSLNIQSGVVVKFKGDYIFSAPNMYALGNVADSIQFIGNTNPLNPQGTIYGISSSPLSFPITSAEYCRFNSLKAIHIQYPANCNFQNNIIAHTFSGAACNFSFNDTVIIDRGLTRSLLYKNKNVIGVPAGKIIASFVFSDNLFIENLQGLEITGALNSTVYVFRNKFFKNSGTPVITKGTASYLYSNLFINNIDDTCGGISILVPDFFNNAVLVAYNTFYNNNGGQSNDVEIDCNSLNFPTQCELTGNIFWHYKPVGNQNRAIFFKGISDNAIFMQTNTLSSSQEIQHESGINISIDGLFSDYPEFLDTLALNLRLAKTSPQIDRGKDLHYFYNSSDALAETDFDNKTHKFNTKSDIGAFEYIPNQFPIILSQTSDIQVCQGASGVMFVDVNDRYEYQWFKNTNLLPGQFSDSLVIQSMDIDQIGIYRLRINNLIDTIWSKTIAVKMTKIPAVTGWEDTLNACFAAPALFKVNFSSDLNTKVYWFSEQKGLFDSLASETIKYGVFIQNDKVWSTIINTCGSISTPEKVILVNTPPVSNLPGQVEFCVGDSVQLTASLQDDSVFWSNGFIGNQIFAKTEGWIVAKIYNKFGCFTLDSTLVIHKETPKIKLKPRQGICPGESVLLDPIAIANSYLWSTGDTTKVIYVNQPGLYKLTATGLNACSSYATCKVEYSPILRDEITSVSFNNLLYGFQLNWDPSLYSHLKAHTIYELTDTASNEISSVNSDVNVFIDKSIDLYSGKFGYVLETSDSCGRNQMGEVIVYPIEILNPLVYNDSIRFDIFPYNGSNISGSVYYVKKGLTLSAMMNIDTLTIYNAISFVNYQNGAQDFFYQIVKPNEDNINGDWLFSNPVLKPAYNYKPLAIELSDSIVNIHLLVGEYLGEFKIDDINPNDQYNIVLLTGNEYPDNDYFTIDGDQLVLKKEISLLTADTLHICLRAEDTKQPENFIESCIPIILSHTLSLQSSATIFKPKVYPNPANDQVIIELPQGITPENYCLELISQLGQIIPLHRSVFGNKIIVSLNSEIEPGIYILHIKSNQFNYSQTIVIN